MDAVSIVVVIMTFSLIAWFVTLAARRTASSSEPRRLTSEPSSSMKPPKKQALSAFGGAEVTDWDELEPGERGHVHAPFIDDGAFGAVPAHTIRAEELDELEQLFERSGGDVVLASMPDQSRPIDVRISVVDEDEFEDHVGDMMFRLDLDGGEGELILGLGSIKPLTAREGEHDSKPTEEGFPGALAAGYGGLGCPSLEHGRRWIEAIAKAAKVTLPPAPAGRTWRAGMSGCWVYYHGKVSERSRTWHLLSVGLGWAGRRRLFLRVDKSWTRGQLFTASRPHVLPEIILDLAARLYHGEFDQVERSRDAALFSTSSCVSELVELPGSDGGELDARFVDDAIYVLGYEEDGGAEASIVLKSWRDPTREPEVQRLLDPHTIVSARFATHGSSLSVVYRVAGEEQERLGIVTLPELTWREVSCDDFDGSSPPCISPEGDAVCVVIPRGEGARPLVRVLSLDGEVLHERESLWLDCHVLAWHPAGLLLGPGEEADSMLSPLEQHIVWRVQERDAPVRRLDKTGWPSPAGEYAINYDLSGATFWRDGEQIAERVVRSRDDFLWLTDASQDGWVWLAEHLVFFGQRPHEVVDVRTGQAVRLLSHEDDEERCCVAIDQRRALLRGAPNAPLVLARLELPVEFGRSSGELQGAPGDSHRL